ncbi:MAG: TlpA family protein disulfide reductase [Flavobacteriales bacterium]
MKKIILSIICSTLTLISCKTQEYKTSFSTEALQATLFDGNGNESTIQEILNQSKGQTTFIDLWASWCSDCIKGMPKVKKLQSQYGNQIAFTFLSMDRDENKWKEAITKYNLKGNHFWFKGLKNWKENTFTQDINLDWIPRYMIIGKDGSIKLFKVIHADDPKLIEAIDTDLK